MREIREFRVLDANAISQGYDLFELMESAGEEHVPTVREYPRYYKGSTQGTDVRCNLLVAPFGLS